MNDLDNETPPTMEQTHEQTGHTPGPWQWYWRTDSSDQTDCGVFWEKNPGQAYSVCRAPRYQKQAQWEADARLIAAAPELLEALKMAIRVLESENLDEAMAGEFEILTDAVQKAEGRTE